MRELSAQFLDWCENVETLRDFTVLQLSLSQVGSRWNLFLTLLWAPNNLLLFSNILSNCENKSYSHTQTPNFKKAATSHFIFLIPLVLTFKRQSIICVSSHPNQSIDHNCRKLQTQSCILDKNPQAHNSWSKSLHSWD